MVRALGRDSTTATIPVIAMSANDVRRDFQDVAQVVDVLQKPFDTGDILRLLKRHAKESQGASTTAVTALPAVPAGPPPSQAVQQQLAKDVYAVLQPGLAMIPKWNAALQNQLSRQASGAIAPFFGQRLLTSTVIQALARILPQALDQPSADEVLLTGSTSCLGLGAILDALAKAGRSGLLTIEQGSILTRCTLRRGLLLAVTSGDDWVDRLPDHIPRESVNRAQQAAKLIGDGVTPLLLIDGLTCVIAEIAERTLTAMVARGGGTYRFTELPGIERLPPALAPIPLIQLELIRWRQVDDLAQVEAAIGSLSQVYRRCDGFSFVIHGVRFEPVERAVLGLVDGDRTIAHVIERSGSPALTVFHAIFRLLRSGLIQALQPIQGQRLVLVIGGDAWERQELESLMDHSGHQVQVADLPIQELEGMISEVSRRSPTAIIHVRGNVPPGFTQAIGSRLDLAGTALVDILDDLGRPLVPGFSACLMPVPIDELLHQCALSGTRRSLLIPPYPSH